MLVAPHRAVVRQREPALVAGPRRVVAPQRPLAVAPPIVAARASETRTWSCQAAHRSGRPPRRLLERSTSSEKKGSRDALLALNPVSDLHCKSYFEAM